MRKSQLRSGSMQRCADFSTSETALCLIVREGEQPADNESDEQDDLEQEDDAPTSLLPPPVPNGRLANTAQSAKAHKSRSASSSIHDRSGITSQPSSRHASTSAGARPVSPIGFNSSQAANNSTTKETLYVIQSSLFAFCRLNGTGHSLNYFFGGGSAIQNGTPGHYRRPTLPDLGAADHRSSNPLAGRRGLEGSAAAYDMKSLDKHLDPSQQADENLGLTEREEMETSLIQSLIASYFSIVRQTIQDLVPKVRQR